MGSSNPSLPIVDISPFLSSSSSSPSSPSPSSSRAATISALASACYDHGFFYLTGHGIPDSTRNTILSHARAFFQHCTPQQKHAIRRQDPGHGIGDGARGYQLTGENVTQGKRDWHEALDLYREIEAGEGVTAEHLVEDKATGAQTLSEPAEAKLGVATARSPPYPLLHGPNLWPSHPADFQAVYTAYIESVRAVGTAVLRAMGEALQLRDPDAFVAATRDSFWVMRVIGYPQLDPELARGGGVSCGAHTDYGCLTLLLTDETRGALQVKRRSKDGGVVGRSNGGGDGDDDGDDGWITADPIPGAYVVNVGDMVELWTNGLVKSTLHRVVHTGQNYRVSVPFFLEPDWDAVVAPLPECVERSRGMGGAEGGKDRGKEYKAVKYGDHLVGKVSGNFYGGGEG